MKTNFFLKRKWSDYRFGAAAILSCFAALFLIILYLKGFIPGLLILILCGACNLLYEFKNHKISGVYINENNIIYKNVLFEKKIDVYHIDCIRVSPEYENSRRRRIIKDKNGNVLFLMWFYHNYYEKDEMDGYDFIEEIKRMFIEKQLACCIYDKEALDYILTLNPNIKVIYEKE